MSETPQSSTPPADAAIPLHVVPRPITPGVTRSLRREPRVRGWWIWAFAMALLFVIFSITRIAQWSADRALITRGELVDAIVIKADSIDMARKQMAPSSRVDLRYTYGGREYNVNGYLEDRKDFIVIGDPVPIRVDKESPGSWTGRTGVDSLVGRLVDVTFLLLPIALLIAAATIEKRRLAKLWTHGNLTEAAITAIQRSPMAPSSQLLTVAPRGTKAKQLLRVYVPGSLAQKGDIIPILTDAQGNRALAVSAVKA